MWGGVEKEISVVAIGSDGPDRGAMHDVRQRSMTQSNKLSSYIVHSSS